MKISLLKAPSRPAEGPVELLLECHERIRRFVRLAQALARNDATQEQIADAARSLVTYFGRSLPLHIEDEERSLRPRLEQSATLADWDRMTEEHVSIEALLPDLLARWRVLIEAPHEREAEREVLGALADDLAVRMEAHLDHEERVLFPKLGELLSSEAQHAIVVEMRARRLGP